MRTLRVEFLVKVYHFVSSSTDYRVLTEEPVDGGEPILNDEEGLMIVPITFVHFFFSQLLLRYWRTSTSLRAVD